jgi:hypothetical protein
MTTVSSLSEIKYKIYLIVLATVGRMPKKRDFEMLLDGLSVHSIAGCLKAFFRELPDPIFPYNFYENVVPISPGFNFIQFF